MARIFNITPLLYSERMVPEHIQRKKRYQQGEASKHRYWIREGHSPPILSPLGPLAYDTRRKAIRSEEATHDYTHERNPISEREITPSGASCTLNHRQKTANPHQNGCTLRFRTSWGWCSDTALGTFTPNRYFSPFPMAAFRFFFPHRSRGHFSTSLAHTNTANRLSSLS